MAESDFSASAYDRVYSAARPELFSILRSDFGGRSGDGVEGVRCDSGIERTGQDRVMINDFFVASRVSPSDMDNLWAGGWRHFGTLFFRYSVTDVESAPRHVIPLRIELSRFAPSRSQTRILKKNQDVQVLIRDTVIDSEKERLFDRHRGRFKDNVPDSLYDFLSPRPASVPCRSQEICVYLSGRLLAISFLDIGETATSAVYAAFEPAEHRRSLGIFTMLCAIEHSRALGALHYYPGYAYQEPGMYDYKKNFSGLEFLDWAVGWKPYVRAN